jgi:hypothetical protein
MPTSIYNGQTQEQQFNTAYNLLTPQEKATYDAANPRPTPTPTSAPTPTPAPTQTPPRTPGLLDDAERIAAEAKASREAEMRKAEAWAAQQRQIRIDGINQAFAPRIEREKEEGQARLSRVAALNFRSGTIGSGVDTTRTGEQKGLNEKAVQGIEAQKAVAIQEVFDKVDALAKDRAESAYKAATESADAQVTRYKQQTQTAMDALKVFGNQGVDAKSLKDVDPNTYATLRDVSGMTDAAIDNYLKSQAPQGTYVWDQAQVQGTKMMVPKVVNGKVTMDTLDLGYTPSPKFKEAIKTDAGVLMINTDGTYDIVQGTGSNDGNSWGEISNNDKSDIENYLRNQPDFSPDDLQKAKTDRQFQAVLLKKIQEEKAAVYNPYQ